MRLEGSIYVRWSETILIIKIKKKTTHVRLIY
jgi:hypothetical protein